MNDAGCSMLGTGFWMVDVGYKMGFRCSAAGEPLDQKSGQFNPTPLSGNFCF